MPERCSSTGTMRETGVRQWWSNVHLQQTSRHNAIDVKQATNYYAACELIIIVKTGIFILMGIISLTSKIIRSCLFIIAGESISLVAGATVIVAL